MILFLSAVAIWFCKVLLVALVGIVGGIALIDYALKSFYRYKGEYVDKMLEKSQEHSSAIVRAKYSTASSLEIQ